MSDIKLNINPGEEYDVVLKGYDLEIVDGIDAIAQNIRIRLQFFLGEFFLDVRQGIPYRRQVFVHNPDELLITQLFRKTIATTAGVADVESIKVSVDKVKRKLTCTFRARTDAGQNLEFDNFILDV